MGLVILVVVLMLAFRWRIYKVRKQMEQQFGEGFGQQSDRRDSGGFAAAAQMRREGEVKVHKTQERPRSACRAMGRHVDFEEEKQ